MENKGQFDDQISYQADYNSHTIFLDEQGFTVLLHNEKKWSKMVMDFHDHKFQKSDSSIKEHSLDFHSIKYILEGANLSRHSGTESTPEYYNFFIGNEAANWAEKVKKHTKVVYQDIYPNIDLEYEAIDERFKYNFILNKGANITDIRIDIKGAIETKVTSDRIYVKTRFGEYSEVMPISYEVHDDHRNQIKMSYVLRGDYIGFETPFFKGKVKTVIDPELIFSTYSGSSVDNFGFTATYDVDGNLYSGGIATDVTKFPGGGYPATAGAYSITYGGGVGREPATLPCDIAISKYSSDGSRLLYATYLGGSDDEYPHSLIVDQDNNLVVFGTSYSGNYPTTNGAVDRTHDGASDIIVTKFNSTGSALIGSTFMGGQSNDGLNEAGSLTHYFYADDHRGEVNIDASGNIYVASCTKSSDFRVKNAIQPTKYGGQDGVVFSLNSNLTQLRWSTYFGGSGNDALYTIDVASDGSYFLSGGTGSPDMEGTDGA
ncbi:hypothetical protein N8368_04870, partial [Bacteroidia bacterium]|nr:hypothetical protein [Bacteroidia bacterium]